MADVREFRENLRNVLAGDDPRLARELLGDLLIEVIVEREVLRVRYTLPFGL